MMSDEVKLVLKCTGIGFLVVIVIGALITLGMASKVVGSIILGFLIVAGVLGVSFIIGATIMLVINIWRECE